ncbi:unnamed protein product [Mycena citricolor]|uniref:Actin cytoskeleton-regulatory complex protein SLA1 n=1 Tax=Mycena citricolor TaxID=2018698 RepID=A0AAD2HGG0_9AGAR|nr:unnamed protein product [Mycena citricolor]
MTEHHYLAVLKASYDYEPDAGAEDEIAIKENQILLLVARVDADWWKVKIKGESQEEESPVGLVPAAYVEPADHTSTVKALYDYEANAPGELTMKEDQTLHVFDREEEWLLVQTEEDGGKAGFVPANYVEESTGGEAQQEAAGSQIVIPDSPPKPAYVDPADRVASSKITADDIQTWAVTEVDKKGKKKKGTLGVGNGAVFFASESDKTPVQKWQTVHVENITVDKGKHIHIDIGGPTPINLHFSISSKDQADAIVAKLNSSKELSSAAAGASSSSSAAAAATPKKNTVHFAPDSPTVIPVSDDEEAEEEEQEEEAEEATPAEEHAANGDGNLATALYDFAADGEDELSVTEGEELTILERDGDEWWKCRNSRGEEGVVPASYLEAGPGTAAAADEDEQDDTSAREAEERAEKERRDKERREKERRDRERREAEEADRAEKAVKDKERAEKERKKQEAQQKAKAAAAAAEAEREKRKKAAAAANARAEAASPAPTSPEPKKSSRSSMDPAARPPADRVREWRDRTGQFRVDAAFLGFNNGKLRLHKTNGVIVEVPAEKMSIDDMKYVEKVMSKQRHKSSAPSTSSGTSRKVSEDDVPLAEAKRQSMLSAKQPKKSTIDWFDFFLNAGCDLDDCTRYADSFEKDKIDETLLLDITDSTMRSLGLREGDIIRVTKAIEKRRPEKKTEDAVDADGSPLKSPPNLFTTAGGALKQPARRGRPQPSKTLPASVDLQAISTVSDQIQRTSSPQAITPTAVQPPPRTSSAPAVAAPPVSGFDDDAWTNRPSSAQPPAIAAAAAAPPARAPSAPPAPVAPTPPPVVAATAPTPAAAPPVQARPVWPTQPNRMCLISSLGSLRSGRKRHSKARRRRLQ